MKQDLIESQIQLRKQELTLKINELILGERKRFIQQYGKYESVDYRTVANQTLTDVQTEQHLMGSMTVGCFYKGSHSKFLVFDIDVKDPAIPLGLIQLLKNYGFQAEDIHLEESGTKGWHLWLFFQTPIRIELLVSFGDFIRTQLGVSKTNIELRPEKPSNSRRHQAPFRDSS
ncbi:TOTE conflict system archaeo-eukaryotic primase domain-containing protein [Gorillibacterium massiliense]|uniref:TOTE conflict system archaeo-eukaryotic primase domain-containing protein n=1 Tax=Gorillibacterium massiliense TaxID=1280390 RepID=UPI0004AFDC4B|nr:hypothetical protein [Gorillibacterium massiliense]